MRKVKTSAKRAARRILGERPSRVVVRALRRLGLLAAVSNAPGTKDRGQLKANTKLLQKKALRAAKEQVAEEIAATENVELQALRKKVKRIRTEILKAPHYRYGSFRPGRKDWEEKWDSSPGRRVLLYGLRDYGSLYQWAEAVNKFTPYAARMVVFYPHEYGFPLDLLMPYPNVTDRSRFQELVDEADIIHIKDEIGFFVGNNRLDKSIFNKSGKPRIYTAYGGQMRKYQSSEAFREYVMSHDARIALTPDLNYEWFNAALVPQAIDAEKNKVLWRDGRKLMHSPSTQIRKGTPDLLKAIEGLDIDFELIHGLPYEECIARKKKANLFFDQAGREITEFLGIDTIIGWYGNAAIEAAVHGIPTIAHLSEEALDGGERAGYDNIRSKCGILNTPFGAEGIRKTISEFFFDASPSDRAEISSRTRKWVENFHSHKAVGAALSRVYNRLI